jgi:hypothetical protein
MSHFFIICEPWVGSSWTFRPTRYLLGMFQILSSMDLGLSESGTSTVVGLLGPGKSIELEFM